MIKDLSVVIADGISLVGQLYLPDLERKYPLICLCHGIPSGEAPPPGDGGYPELAQTLCRQGFAVYWFNFRGAGESGGNLDLAGWVRDLKAVIGYLWSLDGLAKDWFWLIGFSAGAAVSIYVAAEEPRVNGVIACACPAEISPPGFGNSWQAFASHLRDIGAIRDSNFLPSIEEWAYGFQHLSPIEHIARLAPRPVLLIHGSHDDIVPLSHAERLYEKARPPKKLIIIDGAGHRLRRDKRVIDAILMTLRQVPGAPN